MKHFVRVFLSVIALLILVSESLAQEVITDVARRYVNLRPSVLKFSEATGAANPENLRLALSALSTDALRRYGQGPNWDASNPEWKRLALVIESDIEQAIQQIAKDPSIAELSQKSEEVFVRGMSSRLTEPELITLVQFYSGPAGKQLAAIQQQMFDEVAIAISKRQLLMMAGQPKEAPIPMDPDESKQLMGLFDEWIKLQLALLDPGPKHDRSGLQAIPAMAIIALQTNYARYSAAWRDIPEPDRHSILSWRESPGGKKERDAIYETAKELRSTLNLEVQAKMVVDKFAALERRWRILIQSRKRD